MMKKGGARVESAVLKGLSHITLSVGDLSRSVAYYTELLGFSLRARWNRGAYLALGDLWLCLGHDAHVRNSPLAEYSHFALSVDRADFDAFLRKVAEGAHPTWKENTSEGESIYLLDPDGHKLEVHTGSLESRLAALRKEPYDGLVLYDEKRNAHE
jgi:catechol 2,3-dioxygenase-like lactoylglutathione lyase family enzyme